ncbi:MAG: flavin reductase family protein [Oscillospiraceae bacterium]|nr:flavin reductase family protein [Oscillospiraceae bacterium]
MEKITIGQAQKLTSPNPFCLVTVQKPDGGTNVMALSWWTYVSNNPATVLICTSNKGYTGELIKNSGEFGLSFPGKAMVAEAMKAGKSSGRNKDKAAELGIKFIDVEGYDIRLVSGCRLGLACRLVDSHPVGDHTIYIGEVVRSLGDERIGALYAFGGYAELDTVERA